jgi:hypothetical protein
MTMNAPGILFGMALLAVAGGAMAQKSTNIKGNTEIDVSTKNTTAVAVGANNVAKNRIGVVKGDKTGDTKISVSATNVVTVVGGRNKKACTNIGVIAKNDECK